MIIFDEKKYAENLIKNGYKDKTRIVLDNIILVKYWKYLGFSEDEIRKKLEDFMIDFKYMYNSDIVPYNVHKALKQGLKYPLVFDKIVNITQKEIDTINSIDDLELRKILFVLLVIWKFRDKQKFMISNNNLKKLANVKCKNSVFWDYLHKLHDLGYLKAFVYKCKPYYKLYIEEGGNVVLNIKNYDDIISYYLSIVYPEEYTYCAICDMPIKRTSNRRKYCSSCWKDVERKIKRETWHKYKDKYTRSLENPANPHE